MEYLKNTFGYYFTSKNNNTLKSQSVIQDMTDCKIIKNNIKFDTEKFDNSVLNSINAILFYKKNNNSGNDCDENCECKK